MQKIVSLGVEMLFSWRHFQIWIDEIFKGKLGKSKINLLIKPTIDKWSILYTQ